MYNPLSYDINCDTTENCCSKIKSNTNDTSKSEETFLKIVDYATFIDDSYNKKPITSGNKIECKFTKSWIA